MNADVTGPDSIRMALATAVDTAAAYAEEVGGIAAVIDEAADRYEALQMAASTLAHQRTAADLLDTAAARLTSAYDDLQAALNDFATRDGLVAEAVAEAGNLATAEILTGGDNSARQAGPAARAPRSRKEATVPDTPAAPAHRRGHYNPDQPRAADGKWITVGDVLGFADGEVCYATDRVTGTGPVTTDLALIEYPAEPDTQQGAFVSVATAKGVYNPTTGKEMPRPDDPDGRESFYCAPQLDAGEAETLARHVEELANLAESGYRPPEPTKHTRARQQLQHLLSEKHAERRERIRVGEDENFPLTTGELLKLLEEADPTMSAVQTRRKVRADAARNAGGEDGTVWVDLEPDAAGVPHGPAVVSSGKTTLSS